MKRICVVLAIVLCLSGCGKVSTWETLGDVVHASGEQTQLRQVMVQLPADAARETAGMENGISAYQCDGYWLVMQHFPSGDVAATMKALSGFPATQLTVMESTCEDHVRYDWVWTAASEEGEMVCRGAILDDGKTHYTLCVVASTEQAKYAQAQWNGLFASFCLVSV